LVAETRREASVISKSPNAIHDPTDTGKPASGGVYVCQHSSFPASGMLAEEMLRSPIRQLTEKSDAILRSRSATKHELSWMTRGPWGLRFALARRSEAKTATPSHGRNVTMGVGSTALAGRSLNSDEDRPLPKGRVTHPPVL
jgi:hypothetical protein